VRGRARFISRDTIEVGGRRISAVAGLTERDCRARGLTVRTKRHPFRDIGKALVSDRAEGLEPGEAQDPRADEPVAV
jgi:hypothetical protein